VFILALSIHLLAAIFWAGTTYAEARTGILGARLQRLQLRAAIVAMLSGLYLWSQTRPDALRPSGLILALGTLCALAAAVVPGVSV